MGKHSSRAADNLPKSPSCLCFQAGSCWQGCVVLLHGVCSVCFQWVPLLSPWRTCYSILDETFRRHHWCYRMFSGLWHSRWGTSQLFWHQEKVSWMFHYRKYSGFYFVISFSLTDAQGAKLGQSFFKNPQNKKPKQNQKATTKKAKFYSLSSFCWWLFSWLCWILLSILLVKKKRLSSNNLILAQMPLLCLDLSINISVQFFN